MATPHVAGLAALIKSADSSLTPDQVEEMIKATARSFPASCEGCGVGIADAAAAIAVTLGLETPADATDLELKLTGKNGRYQEIDDTRGAIRYHAVVTNLGENDAANVTLTSQFPMDVDLVSVLPDQGSCSGDGLVCELGYLPVGESVTVIFEFVTDASFSRTKMNFTGSVSSDLVDTTSSNNFVLKRFGGALGHLLVAVVLLAGLRSVRRRW
jgi:serine protease